MPPAVRFEATATELHLLYSPQDDDPKWIYRKWERGEELRIKGTFHLTEKHLVQPRSDTEDDEDIEDGLDLLPLRFRVATVDGDYFRFDAEVLDLDCPVLLARDARPTWKWFSAERAVSVLDRIAELKLDRIVIGGPAPDAIPLPAYEQLIKQFPSPIELKRYTLARVAAVVREYVETPVDAEKLYRNVVEKRINRRAADIQSQFFRQEQQKYQLLYEQLTQMLDKEETYPESTWQNEILQIIRLLNPKYIQVLEEVRIPVEGNADRRADVLLVDASGAVDVIEIKKPFDHSIVTKTVYRDNHIPLRELSGSVMQVEKYIYRLNRWGHTGEKALTQRYADVLPPGFQIRITSPCGIIITGRDRNLSPAQRQDFEFVRRKYKSIVDIITYDDLLRRLQYVVSQIKVTNAGDRPAARRSGPKKTARKKR